MRILLLLGVLLQHPPAQPAAAAPGHNVYPCKVTIVYDGNVSYSVHEQDGSVSLYPWPTEAQEARVATLPECADPSERNR